MASPTGTRLQNKIAIVTGSTSGIGRNIALRYASEGAYVVCADLEPSSKAVQNDKNDKHGGTPTHEAINAAYPATPGAIDSPERSIFVKVDTTVSAEMENLVRECVAKFGRLDIMVNNAGIAYTGTLRAGRVHENSEEAWDKIVTVNGKGVWLGCKYAAGQMLSQSPHPSGDRGWIINMASILGFVGMARTSAYSASKGAVVNLTKAVALEYGEDRIHVNAIAPGFTTTPLLSRATDSDPADNDNEANAEARAAMEAANAAIAANHPLGSRMANPEEIAGAAVFLASDDASFVTGHVLAVDGGYLAK